jgi:DNA-binding HxlR family transcriptional regulator
MAANENAETGASGGAPGCPLDPVLSLLAQKWLVHIVWLLGHTENLRFAELQRQLPGDVSAKVLSARLKQLEALNMVTRDDKGTSPPHVEYRLTAYGRSIDDLLENLELNARGLALPVISPASLPEEAAATQSIS